MAFDFWKYHALGNDYLVIDPNTTAFNATTEAVKLVCDRHFGVGSDGILLGPILEEGRIRLRIFNPDGSEAEKSGNGIRIFSRYLVEAGYVKEKTFTLLTLGGEVRVEVLDETASIIKVDMGTVTFRSDEIPVAGPSREVVDEPLAVGDRVFRVTCVSIGNPHCVIPLPEISAELAREYGPRIENHPFFPRRINVQFLKVLDRKNIRIEIWERGAGYTLASGSSSSAAACAAHHLGLVEPNLTVHMPGGEIGIEIAPDGHVHMTGPVAAVARGEFAEEMRRRMKG
ncbi:MAG: diaminopimelate epimerase [Firmicutes bacterium]|nr:diaminopimelate epimerase [Bacillota bacterium]